MIDYTISTLNEGLEHVSQHMIYILSWRFLRIVAVLARYGRTYFAKFDLALLTKIKNLNVQLLVQLSALIIFISCTFKTSLLNSSGFQTAAFLTSIILLCQLVSTY